MSRFFRVLEALVTSDAEHEAQQRRRGSSIAAIEQQLEREVEHSVSLEKEIEVLEARLAASLRSSSAELREQLREAEEACLEAQNERDRLADKYEPVKLPRKFS